MYFKYKDLHWICSFQFKLLFTVTEREVINGILNVKNTKNHCLAYVRYINNINLQNLKKASLFVDILNRSLDTEASKLLANLRDERLPNKIESTNLQRWVFLWQVMWLSFIHNISVIVQPFDTRFVSNIYGSLRYINTSYSTLFVQTLNEYETFIKMWHWTANFTTVHKNLFQNNFRAFLTSCIHSGTRNCASVLTNDKMHILSSCFQEIV